MQVLIIEIRKHLLLFSSILDKEINILEKKNLPQHLTTDPFRLCVQFPGVDCTAVDDYICKSESIEILTYRSLINILFRLGHILRTQSAVLHNISSINWGRR